MRGPGTRVNASGAPRLPRHWKNESARPWRLLGGPVCASLPNSSRSWDSAADQPPFCGNLSFPDVSAHTQRIQDRGSASTTAGLASNSPPACGPAGYLNGMRPGSELGRQVAVDFESDTDFLECGSCPIHSCLPAFHNDQQPKKWRLSPLLASHDATDRSFKSGRVGASGAFFNCVRLSAMILVECKAAVVKVEYWTISR